MNNKEKRVPAFPSNFANTNEYSGMSLRDYMAAKAMQAFIINKIMTSDETVNAAYEMADKMLKERNK